MSSFWRESSPNLKLRTPIYLSRQFFGAGAFGQFGGEKGERKRRRKFDATKGARIIIALQDLNVVSI